MRTNDAEKRAWPITWILLAIGLTAAFASFLPGRARGDERQAWIHAHRPQCCDHRDCRPATVVWTPMGWRVAGARYVVPFGDQIGWPFAEPYVCLERSGRVRCLLMQGGT